MKNLNQLARSAAVIGMASALLSTPALSAEKLRMATIAPGSSAYLVMTTMASTANANQDKYEVSVDATGAATKHMVEAAKGQLDLVMSAPILINLMRGGKAMYKKLDDAPELAKNLSLLYWFPYGAYHAMVYADSDIKTLADLKGKKVFLGPPGGGAFNTGKAWVKANTGMEPGKDYEAVKASWGAALQGFQDRQFDVYINGGIPPFPQVEQLSLTSKLRLLGLDKAAADAALADAESPIKKVTSVMGRWMDVIPAGSYGEGIENTEDVHTIGTMVGVIARADLDEDAVYEVTKAFWENIDEVRKTAPYMEQVNLKHAFSSTNLKLHPGALKYYQEAGVHIPDEIQ